MKRRIKQIAAVALAATMVLGMGTIASAATITVNGTGHTADDGTTASATLKYLQIIKPDTKSATGWTFTNGAGTYFQQAFNTGSTAMTEQQIIAALIKSQDSTVTFTDATLSSVEAATAAQIDKALSLVASNLDSSFIQMSGTTQELAGSASEAGVYAIKATETGYTYKTMSAYVGFGGVEGGTYSTLQNGTATAKRSKDSSSKTVNDADHVVAIGDIVTFTITTEVPMIDAQTGNRTFYISDTITGADYYLTGSDSMKSVGVESYTGSDTFAIETGKTIASDGSITTGTDHQFVVDLSSLITDDNANAGKTVTITYTAKMAAEEANNHEIKHVSGEIVDYNEVHLYTGNITLTKYAADSTEDTLGDNAKLAGAGFEVYKGTSTDPLKFTKDSEGVYTYAPDATGTAGTNYYTTVYTAGDAGTLLVKGLDIGTYTLKEVEAPTGYSINANDAKATINVTDGTVANAKIAVTTSMIDTKLSALPSTGGIGTTIFTVVGCAIIVVAGSLLIVSRRKKNA